jgi:hypothetical protein
MASLSLPSKSAARSACLGLVVAALLSGCGAQPQARAEIEAVRRVGGQRAPALEVQQRLDFSPRMLDALSNGIALRIDYRLEACEGSVREMRPLWLRFYPLMHEFELRWQGDEGGRRFARRSALLAALDQVRVTLPESAAQCAGELSLELELTALPAPLRLPALIGLEDWRLAAGPHPWSAP